MISHLSTTTTLRVMGIDPGLADVGWGVIDWSPVGGTTRLVGYGVVETERSQPLAERLSAIHRQLGVIVERHKPSMCAVETLFFAKNVKTALLVAHGRAACMLAVANRSIEVSEYTPLEIKQALTGRGRASKAQIQQMTKVILGLDEIPEPNHAADALAAALTHIHSRRMNEQIGAFGGHTAPGPELEENEAKSLLAQMRGRRRRRR